MKERWRAADDIVSGQEHAITDALPIVQDGPVRETGCFGKRGRARGELDVDDIVWRKVVGGRDMGLGYIQ